MHAVEHIRRPRASLRHEAFLSLLLSLLPRLVLRIDLCECCAARRTARVALGLLLVDDLILPLFELLVLRRLLLFGALRRLLSFRHDRLAQLLMLRLGMLGVLGHAEEQSRREQRCDNGAKRGLGRSESAGARAASGVRGGRPALTFISSFARLAHTSADGPGYALGDGEPVITTTIFHVC